MSSAHLMPALSWDPVNAAECRDLLGCGAEASDALGAASRGLEE